MTKEHLNEIWDSEYFSKGYSYFWLYNYNLFRIINKTEYQELNETLIHQDKHIFAIADATNGDYEHEAYLFFDFKTNTDIFIQSKFVEPFNLTKISCDLIDLFGTSEFSQVFIEERDMNFWTWYEQSFESYGFDEVVPKGVLPNFDLRSYFKYNVKGTFLSDHKEHSTLDFKEYFKSFGVDNLDTEKLFEYKPSAETLTEFLDKLNNQLGEEVFYFIFFTPSAFWGIINYKILTTEEKQSLVQYGLLINR